MSSSKEACPARYSPRPSVFSICKALCTFGLRISPSIKRTFIPLCAHTHARLNVVVDFPSPGPPLRTVIVRAIDRAPVKFSFAQRIRYPSANREFGSSWDRNFAPFGITARTLIPKYLSTSSIVLILVSKYSMKNAKLNPNTRPTTILRARFSFRLGFTGRTPGSARFTTCTGLVSIRDSTDC